MKGFRAIFPSAILFLSACGQDPGLITGTLSGLSGTGLVLLDNGADPLALTKDGHFVFAEPAAHGTSYRVTVKTQPSNPVQTCAVANGTGTIGNSDVREIIVTCTTGQQAVGGNVDHFLYVTDADDEVLGYSIDPGSGELAVMQAGPFRTGAKPAAIALDPTDRFAYVANDGDDTVSAYRIDATTGALSSIEGSPFATGTTPVALVVDPGGQFLYVSTATPAPATAFSSDFATIWSYAIDGASGALTPTANNPLQTTLDPAVELLIPPNGKFLYLVNGGESVYVYALDRSTGDLAEAGMSAPLPFYYLYNGVITPDGRFLYATGAYTPVAGFAIDATTGALSLLGSSPYNFFALDSPFSITVDPSGSFVYVGACNCAGSDYPGMFDGYTVNGNTGQLMPITASPFASGYFPSALAFDPGGKFAYAANSGLASVPGSYSLSGYAIDAANGLLAPLAGTPVAVSAAPLALAVAK